MKKLLNVAFIYMLAGVASGLFYREFTKANDFPEGKFTQLGLAENPPITVRSRPALGEDDGEIRSFHSFFTSAFLRPLERRILTVQQ